MTSRKLKCNETVELVTDYLEKALLPEMESVFSQHLHECSECTLYVDQMRRTVRTLRQLTDTTTSREEQAALLKLFQEWQKNQPHHLQSGQSLD